MRPTRRLRLAGFFARALLHKPRAVGGFLALLLILLTLALCGRPARPNPEPLTPKETRAIYAALLEHVVAGGPNHLHSRRLYYYAPPFARAAGADVDIVRAAALLHDATKEDGKGEPKERFCTHGEQGSELARDVLTKIGKSESFTERASQAVLEHMGPCGFNLRFFARRFMSKFCDRKFPRPSTPEAQTLYDIDMLDLMTVDGVVKVAELRQRNPEFGKEPLEASVKTGPDSAWKSVVDAKQTLMTPLAESCGADLVAHTAEFIDGLDFKVVTTIPELKKAAADYLAKRPLPECLPRVPDWDRGPMP
ncbi:MAG: HD domain-containing protein [Polyangiaceae bacterium]